MGPGTKFGLGFMNFICNKTLIFKNPSQVLQSLAGVCDFSEFQKWYNFNQKLARVSLNFRRVKPWFSKTRAKFCKSWLEFLDFSEPQNPVTLFQRLAQVSLNLNWIQPRFWKTDAKFGKKKQKKTTTPKTPHTLS